MLIDEKNTTLGGQFKEIEAEFDAIAQLPVNSTKSYVNKVDFSQ